MSESRQLPLFQQEPAQLSDLNPATQLRHTIVFVQGHLIKEGKSEHTVKAFTADLQLLGEFTGADVPVGDYTTTRLNEFLDWLEYGRGVPCSRKSYARRVTTLKVYFKWLKALGAIGEDPARPVLQRSGPAPLAEILTRDELADALIYARGLRTSDKPDARPELLLRLIATTGIKKSEAMRLMLDHLDTEKPEAPLLIVKHKVRNVYKERRIALDAEWLPVLREYLAQYAPQTALFTCTARNLEYILEDISEGAGLDKKISFEMLRWTSAVHDYKQGMAPEQIRDKLGLSDASWVETFSKIKRLAAL